MIIPCKTRARLAALLPAVLLCAAANAQNLPPSAPTQPAPSVPQSAQYTPPEKPAYRARVDYSANQLTVTAENSSLTAILHDISQQTGMKITGAVSDERVFGTYGPGTTHQVLNLLLDGAGSNVLFREGANHIVSELVFTPRTGAATPPDRNAAAAREETDLPPQLGGRRRGRPFDPNRPQDLNNQPPSNTPNQEQPANPEQQQSPGTAPDPNATPSPNGVKTPAQIYEDLIRQQQQSPQTPPQS